MLSDVLSGAVDQIQIYQRRQPEIYAEFGEEIDKLVTVMDGFRTFLDSDSSFPDGDLEPIREELRRSVADLYVRKIETACGELRSAAKLIRDARAAVKGGR